MPNLYEVAKGLLDENGPDMLEDEVPGIVEMLDDALTEEISQIESSDEEPIDETAFSRAMANLQQTAFIAGMLVGQGKKSDNEVVAIIEGNPDELGIQLIKNGGVILRLIATESE